MNMIAKKYCNGWNVLEHKVRFSPQYDTMKSQNIWKQFTNLKN